MDNNMINVASFIASELRASSPYRTGNMQRSIAVVAVDESTIEIVIAVDYASYVNEQKKHKHWIQRVLNRCLQCLSQGEVNETTLQTELNYDVIYGGNE